MSSHWYRQDGRTQYTVIGANGKERDTTLADARKLGLVPSVTTITQIIAKPQLEDWKVIQGIMAALTTQRLPGETDDAFIARILSDSREQARKAAEEGKRVHDAIECSFKPGYNVPAEYQKHVQGWRAELKRLFPHVTDWISEQPFAHPFGYGGKVDLHSPSTGIVVDAKGKDGDFTELDSRGKPKRLIYDQPQQIGAYQFGLKLPPAPGAIIFFSRTHPGACRGEIVPVEDMAQGAEEFRCALELWRACKRFNPAF